MHHSDNSQYNAVIIKQLLITKLYVVNTHLFIFFLILDGSNEIIHNLLNKVYHPSTISTW